MLKFILIYLMCVSISINVINSRAVHNKKTVTISEKYKADGVDSTDSDCQTIPDIILTQILGPAFNSRYMSIEQPAYTVDDDDEHNIKRKADVLPPFYVDDTFTMELSNRPAWEVLGHEQIEAEQRIKRASSSNGRRRNEPASKRPWECEAKIKWLDLGPEYFPRYLRTVECTKHLCWYGHYTCQPRSFTVKLLRRRRGQCISFKQSEEQRRSNIRVGVEGLPGELRELWIWEERAVNFCCDCAAPR